MTPRSRRGEEGQASVELALTLPVVVLLMLAVLQVVVVARDFLLVQHAARAAAREAAVDPRPASIDQAARIAAPALKAHRLATETSHRNGAAIVRVTVIYRAETDIPMVGPLVPDIELVGKAAIRDETSTQRL